MGTPTVVALHLNVGSRAPLTPVTTVNARPDEGLDGDRRRPAKRTVLLVEHEVLERFGLAAGAVREQITVRGLELATLTPGGRIRIGSAVLEVGGMCAPCERMNELQPGLRAELEGRRGRFFRVVEAGTFVVGDAIALLPSVPTPAG